VRLRSDGCRADRHSGAPTEDTPSVALAFEAKASSIPPQHIDPEQADDAGALTKGLQDVALVPQTTA
jgi:hypothetical protein